ncbi:hypothetical protein CDAR_41201 [Caerostris darwini]|uniref:Uncharacterized protein n=1 Tax=Caerostris darwini TaxID=1538125 RepID=A0AAV4SJB0_9ARAC|nr:hypothetical protein CDAR_41201 [Caerostris darwini]
MLSATTHSINSNREKSVKNLNTPLLFFPSCQNSTEFRMPRHVRTSKTLHVKYGNVYVCRSTYQRVLAVDKWRVSEIGCIVLRADDLRKLINHFEPKRLSLHLCARTQKQSMKYFHSFKAESNG